MRPGDTLVLVAPNATCEWADQVKAEVDKHLPGVKLAVVADATQALVYRPEPPVMHIYGTRGPAGTWCTRQDGAIGDRAEATCPACIEAYDAGPETPREREMYAAWAGKAA